MAAIIMPAQRRLQNLIARPLTAMIEDYIRANPEVVREVLIQLGEREAEERRQAAMTVLRMMLVTHSSAMLTPASSSMNSRTITVAIASGCSSR